MNYAAARAGTAYNFQPVDQNVSVTFVTGLAEPAGGNGWAARQACPEECYYAPNTSSDARFAVKKTWRCALDEGGGVPVAERDWVRPEMPGEAAGTAWVAGRNAGFELRPLSLGEVLDRTFALYRSRFTLFAAISMISATVNVLSQAVSLATAHSLMSRAVLTPAQTPHAALATILTITSAQGKAYVVLLLVVLVSAITHAATALAMTQVYLGKPASAKAALGSAFRAWYRWIGIGLWQLGSLLWLPFAAAVPALLLLGFGARSNNVGLTIAGGVLITLAFLAGFPVGVILYLRNALAVPAAVTEGLTVRQAMRRSKILAAGSKGRVFVVLLIAGCLLEVVGILQTPVAFLMLAAPNQKHYLAQACTLVLAFAGHMLVAPVALIGLTLVYFDQRVRKEAFDVELLLEGARGETATGAGLFPPDAPEGYAPRL